MNLPDQVIKYLKKYSLNGWSTEWNPVPLSTIIVIPAIKEQTNIERLISSFKKLDKTNLDTTLFLFVINNMTSPLQDVKEENACTLKYLRDLINSQKNSELNIALIDASSEGNELSIKDGGVGLARKIGMDESLKLFNYNSPEPKIIVCLDADCTVSKNYITGIKKHFNSTKSEAASIYFEHSPEPLTDGIICYEIFLRYYVLGLKYSKSPYAFHTIGSSMACTVNSYIKIEGMNKKKAAEDFYFLEKLAKNTSVSRITNVTVYPSQRDSWRVPFGTGQRITRFNSFTHDEYLLYNPEIFSIIKQWLILLEDVQTTSPKKILLKSKDIHPQLTSFLEKNNFLSDWENILKASRSSEQISKQTHKWFDGFKTLKLVHYLRDNGFPNTDMFKALNKLFDMSEIVIDFRTQDKLPSYEIRILYLKKLRELDRS